MQNNWSNLCVKSNTAEKHKWAPLLSCFIRIPMMFWLIRYACLPEAAGHKLCWSSLRPVDVEPESLFDPGVDCRASFLHIRQLQGHHTCRRWQDTERITKDQVPSFDYYHSFFHWFHFYSFYYFFLIIFKPFLIPSFTRGQFPSQVIMFWGLLMTKDTL